MIQLPKKLQEARDYWAFGYTVSARDTKQHRDACMAFDYCYQTLAPEIEKLVEALETGIQEAEAVIAMTSAKPSPGVELGQKALAQWREFVGEK